MQPHGIPQPVDAHTTAVQHTHAFASNGNNMRSPGRSLALLYPLFSRTAAQAGPAQPRRRPRAHRPPPAAFFPGAAAPLGCAAAAAAAWSGRTKAMPSPWPRTSSALRSASARSRPPRRSSGTAFGGALLRRPPLGAAAAAAASPGGASARHAWLSASSSAVSRSPAPLRMLRQLARGCPFPPSPPAPRTTIMHSDTETSLHALVAGWSRTPDGGGSQAASRFQHWRRSACAQHTRRAYLADPSGNTALLAPGMRMAPPAGAPAPAATGRGRHLKRRRQQRRPAARATAPRTRHPRPRAARRARAQLPARRGARARRPRRPRPPPRPRPPRPPPPSWPRWPAPRRARPPRPPRPRASRRPGRCAGASSAPAGAHACGWRAARRAAHADPEKLAGLAGLAST